MYRISRLLVKMTTWFDLCYWHATLYFSALSKDPYD